MVYGENEGEVFLGRSVTTHKNVSEATMQKVDAGDPPHHRPAVRAGEKLIEDNRDKVEAMAKALLEWETIDADQINDIMAGKPPRPPKPAAGAAAAAADRRAARPAAHGQPPTPRRAEASLGHARGFSMLTSQHPALRPLQAGARRPLVMGVVNVTPDSFSDGGRFLRSGAAVDARAGS